MPIKDIVDRPINVKDLTIEPRAPHAKPPFEIPTQIWESLVESANSRRSKEKIKIAADLAIIEPGQRRIEVTDSDWRNYKEHVESPLSYYRDLKIVDPPRFRRSYGRVSQYLWNHVSSFVENGRKSQNYTSLINIFAAVRIIDSRRLGEFMREEDKRLLQESLKQNLLQSTQTPRAVRIAANLRILGIDPDISEEQIHLWSVELKRLIGPSRTYFWNLDHISSIARDLSILTAKGIKITKNGIVLLQEKPPVVMDARISLPQERSF